MVITIKQANGIVHEVPWDEEAGATPILVEAMILDLKIEDSQLREAAREHCLNHIKGWSELFENPEEADGIPMSELYNRAEAFIAGHEAAIKMFQPYWKNPLTRS